MAKRNANDRNAVALQKRAANKAPDTWTAKDGRVIKLKKPDLMFIQQAIHSVEFPDEPTYEVKIGSRTVEYPLDAEVIKQTEDPVEKQMLSRKWMTYQIELSDASQDQAKRGTGATFFEGTEPDIEMMEGDTRWRKKMKVTGWPVPDDPEEAWVFYLQTSLPENEITSLCTAVVRKAGGVSEELIGAAEDLFRDNLSTEPEAGDLEVAEADQK